MPLFIGDDYPEASESQDREDPAPGRSLRRRPGLRYGWAPGRARRPRSMLIEDAPGPAEDEDGAQDPSSQGYGEDGSGNYGTGDGDDAGRPHPRRSPGPLSTGRLRPG